MYRKKGISESEYIGGERQEQRYSGPHAAVRQQRSQGWGENRGPFWYLIGIDPVEPLEFKRMCISIHRKTCICIKIQKLATQKQKKRGKITPVYHTSEEEKPVELGRDAKMKGK